MELPPDVAERVSKLYDEAELFFDLPRAAKARVPCPRFLGSHCREEHSKELMAFRLVASD